MKKNPLPSVPSIEPEGSPSAPAAPRVKTTPTARRRSPSANGNGPGHENGVGTDGVILDVELLLSGLVAIKNGDFNVRLPLVWEGSAGRVADAFNEVAELMFHSTAELSRISRLVGKEGRIQER